MDDILKRVPPHSIEAEQSVLGAILLDNGAIDRALGVVSPDDFYREAHREMFTAMFELAAGKSAIDAITLTNALRARGTLESTGAPAYITDLAVCVPGASNVEHYAAIVRDKAVLRRLGALGHTLVTDAYDSPGEWSIDHTEELLASAEHDLAEIANSAVRRLDPKKSDVLKSALWQIEHRVSNAISTGLKPIDDNFSGFLRGETTMLGGRTSRGKTALALNIAINAAREKIPVAYVTLEMPAEQVWLRAVGTLAHVNMFDASRYGYREGEKEKCAAAAATLESILLEIIYRPALQPRGLRLECKRLMREAFGLKLAIVDYVGLMRGNHRERERWNEMREVIIALKNLAGELGIPLLLLSQLSRECGENERPELSHLRDTGTAEEHSSNVLFIYQPEKSTMDASGYEEYDLVIAKQRNGPAGGRISLRFKKAWGLFSE